MLGKEYKESQYIDRLRNRFPFLAEKTNKELFEILEENKERNEYNYDSFPRYERNLKERINNLNKLKQKGV